MAETPLQGMRMLFRRRHDDSPSLVQLVRSLFSDGIRLVRVELDLVRARFSRMLKRTGIALGILFAAAFTAVLGLVGLLVTVGIALAIVLPAWAAALVVAGALVVGGAAAGMLGVRQLRTAMDARTHGPPEIETELQETRFRLEAELDAITARLDPRGHSHTREAHVGSANGHAR